MVLNAGKEGAPIHSCSQLRFPERFGVQVSAFSPFWPSSETDDQPASLGHAIGHMGEPLRSYESPVMENQSQFSASLSGMILHLNAQDQETHARLRQLEDSVKELLEAPLKRSEPSPEEMQRINDAHQQQDSAMQKAGEAVESVELLRKQARHEGVLTSLTVACICKR